MQICQFSRVSALSQESFRQLKPVCVCVTVSCPSLQLVGVRIPDHPFMRDLARACPGPLALTSANISSQGSTLSVLVRLLPPSGISLALAEPQALSAEL